MNFVFAGLTLILLTILFHRKIRESASWKATVTPLASIIGSGFLVIAPVLKSSLGSYATLGILGLVVFAFCIGEALRFLINHENDRTEKAFLKLFGELALASAYVISVAFYIRVLSVFALKAFHIESELISQLLASIILLTIGLMGYFRGLKFLEVIEEWSVNTKLSIIVGFLFCLLIYDVQSFSNSLSLDLGPAHFGLAGVQTLLGALVITQGFETSLYLDNEYDAKTRIRTMRYSQIISALIYVLFVALVTPIFPMIKSNSETTIIEISGVVATLLPLGLIIGSQLSQFSAAVADTIGAGGLGQKLSRGKFSERSLYLMVTLFSIVMVWGTNLFEIISFASKAFALYYLIQVVTAIRLAWSHKKNIHVVGFLLIAGGLIFCLAMGKAIE